MQFDVIIIGSGPGGYVAAVRASQLGLKTAVVERESLGGICLNWGCIPTKALLKSAQVLDEIKHARDFGISVNNPDPDFKAIIKRSRNVAEGMSKGVQFLMKKNKIEVIRGSGKLKSGKQVAITDDTGKETIMEVKNIILAVGARSRELPGLKIDGKKIIGYRKAMALETLPASMVIAGSGAIGMEFAWFYKTLGTKVTLVEMLPTILPLEDEEISAYMERHLLKNGMDILKESTVGNVDTSGSRCMVKINTKSGEKTVECDIVLSAVGIAANIENIGIEDLGIAVDKGRILTDNFYRTNIPSIHAIGDCIQGPALAHVASAEGIICVEKIAGMDPEPLNYNNIPACTYCQPEVASVGYTEKDAKEAGYDIKVGKFPFTASGKANASGYRDGFVKVIIDSKYGEILGAHMIGSNVTELIAEIVTARKLETTAHEIIKSVHPHPTMSEAIMEATAAAIGEVIHL
ncbi:MAG: dihydrolipoyl dehydrogenase [Bacteroidetes bacterium]|nr:dihydrolipoyl dehydrogenase [Bacteroidota bacterium]